MFMEKSNSFLDKAIAAMFIVVLIASIVGCTGPIDLPNTGGTKHFSSLSEIKDYLSKNSQNNYRGYGYEYAMMGATQVATTTMMKEDTVLSPSASASSYSTTNVQVENVDEADFVKNDAKYIYKINNLNRENSIVIVDAYPAESAKIVSTTKIDGNPQQIYINGDRLVVIGSRQAPVDVEPQAQGAYTQSTNYMPRYYGSGATFIDIYDVADRSNPKKLDSFEFQGTYVESRMIGDYVYPIIKEYVYSNNVELPVMYENDIKQTIPADEVEYFDYQDNSYTYTHIPAIKITGTAEAKDKVFMLGNSMNIYVSQDNIYLSHQKTYDYYEVQRESLTKAALKVLPASLAYQVKEAINDNNSTSYDKAGKLVMDYLDGLTPEEKADLEKKMQEEISKAQSEMQKNYERTIIDKISIDKDQVEFKATGEVPGYPLNQFSMDEYEGNFRIATTTGHVARMASEATAANHIYILDENMDMIGKLEDLAPGEKIYSARFMGKKGYLVTFKKVDPLFVIDLENPKDPKVLGKLKIPGYSDYLQPYDENHIIGIGKDAIDAEEGDFAWYQGIKVALFDVSDVENPKEVGKLVIGDRGTTSEALNDHKAVLFDKDKNMLVLPITLAEINRDKYQGKDMPANTYGDFVWQGAYVLHISPDDGIKVDAKITHNEDNESFKKSGYYYYNSGGTGIRRSLYMDNVLYTVSDATIKMNDMDNSFEEINSVSLK